MTTCLDDIKASLDAMSANIAALSPTGWDWSTSLGVLFVQGDVLSVSGWQLTGRPPDDTLVVVNASLQPTSNGASSNELTISGLPAAAQNGALIGTATIFSSGSTYQCGVVWFSDGQARLYPHGVASQFGITPTNGLSTSDTVLLNLSYRTT